MDELELVNGLRDEIPPGAGIASARRALGVEFTGTMGTRRRHRSRWLAAVAAAVVIAAVAVPLTRGGGSTVLHRPSGQGQGGPSTAMLGTHQGVPVSAVQLVDYATRAAATESLSPRPNQWEYFKRLSASSSGGGGGMLLAPPDRRVTSEYWVQVSGSRIAHRVDGKVEVLRPSVSVMGQPYGWRSVAYPYLNSLPSDPQQLKRVIASAMREQRHIGGGMFDAVQALMDNVVVPPPLRAELYAVLASLPGVHYESTATSIAGRTGVGFSEIEEGRIKHEIVIDPHSYAYLGNKYVAIRSYRSVGTDRTVQVAKGQILGWSAMVDEGIVDHPGDIPAS